MDIPILLYDLNGEKISKHQIIKSHSFYFYTYQYVTIKILDGTGLLYSTKFENSQINTISGIELSGNYGYTLFVPDNDSTVTIEISIGKQKSIFKFELKLDNIITPENEHYLDLLTNYNLPSFKELQKATLDDVDDLLFNDEDLLKRLLLDFRDILKHAGTKKSIEKFLYFLGYGGSQLEVIDEKINNKIKTGNYHIIYDNNIAEGLTENNLPNYKLQIRNIDNFFVQLAQAISLSNTYFTIEEQEITKFHLQFLNNLVNYHHVNSDVNMIITHDTKANFDDVTIDLWTHIDSINKEHHIVNTLQQETELYRSEVKIKKFENQHYGLSQIFTIEQEIFDDDEYDDENFEMIERLFGIVCHLNINAPNKYINIRFYDNSNTANYVEISGENIINELITIKNSSKYLLEVILTDGHNNIDKYYYEWDVTDDFKRIDFDSFNTKFISDDMMVINNINLDVDAPTRKNSGVFSDRTYILPSLFIPQDLSEYYNSTAVSFLRWLSYNERYILPNLHNNNILNRVTETIPLNNIEQWLEIVSIPIIPTKTLKLRIFNAETLEYELIDYTEIGEKYPTFDKLFITAIDVITYENDENDDEAPPIEVVVPHYFITSTETGIEFAQNTFDLVLTDDISEPESIYDLIEIDKIKIPTNYDIILFHVGSAESSTPTYISNSIEPGVDIDVPHTYVKSIYPRMISIENMIGVESLKIGDIILCRLSDKYIANETDIHWEVRNSFTDELLHEESSYMLKYRITRNTIYNIVCNFIINGKSYTIRKNSLFSSFEKIIFD